MINVPAMASEEARRIASLFDLPGRIEIGDFAAKGNINRRTYLITAGPGNHRKEYLLQQLNPAVFTQPRAVMDAMILCLGAQRKAIAEGMLREGEEWETFRLIPTKDGKRFLEIADGANFRCWRMMTRIQSASTYQSLREISNGEMRLHIADEAGKGLALFGALTSAMDPIQIRCPLAGYRDTDLYYAQFHSILEGNRTLQEAAVHLPADEVLRRNTELHFLVQIDPEEYRRRRNDSQVRALIELALKQKTFALALSRELKAGSIRKVVVHGDAKLGNFLFNPTTGNVKALIDLDTIMPHTWLSDWGDMTRSLVNIAGEREKDPDKIDVDLEIFRAVSRGFLRTTRQLDVREMDWMADAPQILALELGIRFLTDYLRGDSYFMRGPGDPPDMNKSRALVQFRLFEKLRKNSDLLKRCIREI